MDNEDSMVHHGRNLKRIREIFGVKQETLASTLGLSQQAVSKLEQKEAFEEPLLDKISKALGIPADAIIEFDESTSRFNVQNNYSGANSGSGTIGIFQNSTINPLEKVFELLDENRKLYERLLQAEKDKNELYQRLLDR